MEQDANYENKNYNYNAVVSYVAEHPVHCRENEKAKRSESVAHTGLKINYLYKAKTVVQRRGVE